MAPQPDSLLVPAIEKPPLTRSRSSTTPSRPPYPTLDLSATRPDPASRSHSFLSPVIAKPRTSQTLPDATSSSRLHIPITAVRQHRSDREHRDSSRHRHTKSDAHGGGFRSHRRDRSDGLPHLAAGIAAERERRVDPTKLSSDPWSVLGNDLRRIASNRSGRTGMAGSGVGEGANLRRTTSDPKKRTQRKQKSEIEILLDRAEAKTMAKRAAISHKHVDRLRRTNAEAEEELQRQLAAVNKTSVDLTRRLDYTYYNLLEKVGNLVAIVQSFHSLSSQSKDMIDHFTKEASMLERDVRIKLERFRTSFEEREDRVRTLEERGARAKTKAQDLGARLEKARQRVEAWERKEGVERRRRSRLWRSVWTVLIVVLVVLFFGLTWREWRSEVDIVRMALMDEKDRVALLNQSLFLEKDVVERTEVPDDVKDILSRVAERKSRPAQTKATSEPANLLEPDDRLRALDEL